MRNNRQHKKLSKQAMDLLIKHYGLKRDSFSLECELDGKYRQEWHWWSEPCYWYGESDQHSSLSLLIRNLIDDLTDWTGELPVYVGDKLPVGDPARIRFVKRHANSGTTRSKP